MITIEIWFIMFIAKMSHLSYLIEQIIIPKELDMTNDKFFEYINKVLNCENYFQIENIENTELKIVTAKKNNKTYLFFSLINEEVTEDSLKKIKNYFNNIDYECNYYFVIQKIPKNEYSIQLKEFMKEKRMKLYDSITAKEQAQIYFDKNKILGKIILKIYKKD